MTEDELRQYLQERGRTAGTIQSILEGTSAEKVLRQAKEQYGHEISGGDAEETARRWRREFVESISALEAGGAMWSENDQNYYNRNDFPPDR